MTTTNTNTLDGLSVKDLRDLAARATASAEKQEKEAREKNTIRVTDDGALYTVDRVSHEVKLDGISGMHSRRSAYNDWSIPRAIEGALKSKGDARILSKIFTAIAETHK